MDRAELAELRLLGPVVGILTGLVAEGGERVVSTTLPSSRECL